MPGAARFLNAEGGRWRELPFLKKIPPKGKAARSVSFKTMGRKLEGKGGLNSLRTFLLSKKKNLFLMRSNRAKEVVFTERERSFRQGKKSQPLGSVVKEAQKKSLSRETTTRMEERKEHYLRGREGKRMEKGRTLPEEKQP